LNQQITSEAKSLTQALRGDSKTQGNWGELQLETIMQSAGLEKGVHYLREKNEKTEDGENQRLDFIVNLPDGKHLIIDSKVSLTAYSKYHDTENEAEKEKYLNEHVLSIRNHIKLLSDKGYQSLRGLRAPDYVFMYIANEPALSAAQRVDPNLFETALQRNIAVVSPTTLLVTMRTVAFIWRQEKQNKNALEIARQAGDLYDKFVGLCEELNKLGTQMDTAKKTFESSMKKLSEGSGNLIRRTEKIRQLGAKTSKNQDPRLLDRADTPEDEKVKDEESDHLISE
jgi:DNA recombination protein RmuC